ncbi:MAG: RNA-guided endonuclease InsQ/TnpB family protein [Nitrososphaeria archaeon]
MAMAGQLEFGGTPEPTPQAIPAVAEKQVVEVRPSNRRTNKVRLLPRGSAERKLERLGDLFAKAFNELNYMRRQQLFSGQRIDLEGTARAVYEKYKSLLGSANVQQVINKNTEAWSSFFSLLKAKKEGRLPGWLRVKPPGYMKEDRKRRLLLVIRNDGYAVDEQNRTLILRRFKLRIPFAGRLQWYGKQGRLEIYYDETKQAWYASIPVEVGVEAVRNIVKGERKEVQREKPKGNKSASIDLGINILASVIVSDGTWLLYRGSRAKEDFFYMQRRISEIRSLEDRAKNLKLSEWAEELRLERRRLEGRLNRRVAHLYRTLASHLIKKLWSLGVSAIYLGYPYEIAQDKGNKLTENLWSYRELMDTIEHEAQEYGMKVYEVIEHNTSRLCAYHGVEVTRSPRGVVKCPLGHRLHSDLNGALNILRKAAGLIVKIIAKPLSYIVMHSGVAPAKGE